MKVIEIVQDYLSRNGYHGLYYADVCGCEVDDLAPCGNVENQCKPGHKIPCNPETCQADGTCDWHIGEQK